MSVPGSTVPSDGASDGAGVASSEGEASGETDGPGDGVASMTGSLQNAAGTHSQGQDKSTDQQQSDEAET